MNTWPQLTDAEVIDKMKRAGFPKTLPIRLFNPEKTHARCTEVELPVDSIRLWQLDNIALEFGTNNIVVDSVNQLKIEQDRYDDDNWEAVLRLRIYPPIESGQYEDIPF